MADIGEVKAAVARTGEDLPLLVLQDAIDVFDEQCGRLAEALTGTGNDDACAALSGFAAAADAIRQATDAHQAARSQCEEYVYFA